jgi:PAS domain S-box-containing protein
MNRCTHPVVIILLLIFKVILNGSTVQSHAEGRSTFQPASPAIHFNKLNSENGLSNNFLTSAVQDKPGFMWFGSRYGLNKFDGMTVTVYTNDPDNPASISNNYAWYLFVDRAERLWVATWGGGLNLYDPISDSFIRYQHDEKDPDSLDSDLVWYVYEDRNGTIWVATDGGGLNRLDLKAGKFRHYHHDLQDPTSISHTTVTQIAEDSSGSLWVGTYGGGLNKLEPDTGTFKRYQHDAATPNSLSNDNIWSLRIDSNERLWIGTEGGLDLYTPETETFIHYKNIVNNPQSISHNTILTIYEDRTGYLWIGTFGGGLNKFDPSAGIFTRYMHRPFDDASLCDDTVYHIYEDRAGTMWIATENGINSVDPGSRRFLHYKNSPVDLNSLSSNKVRTFYEDQDGIIWIGTEGGGINRFDTQTNSYRHFNYQMGIPDTLSSNSVTAIAPAPENTLWVGTEGGGLNRFDPQTGKSVQYRHINDNTNSLAVDTIWDLSVDKQGHLWIVMDGGGLDRFDPEQLQFTHFRSIPNDPKSLVSDWALCVFADSHGIIWVGTDTGLSRFDPEQNSFQNYLTRQNTIAKTENNSIYCVFEDKKGTIWIGTNYGLKQLSEIAGDITVYSEHDGLAGNYVANILEDNLGFLWISTNKGLSRFNPKTVTFRNFDKEDGLQSNYFLWGSGLKSRSNELYFGGINGFNRFNPEKLQDNQYIPPVVLTDFQLFNKSVVPGTPFLPKHINCLDQLTLTCRQSVFSLEFAALNFQTPQKNRYCYMLEGFEDEWNHVGSGHRYATYTNLDPGAYTFHVKASNNDGVWNNSGAKLEIIIKPPWWKAIWFKVMVGLSILVIIVSVLKYVLRLLSEIREREKAEEALRQTSKDLRASQKIAHLGSWRLDITTNKVEWTEELYKMFGFDPMLPPPPYTEHQKLFTPESWQRLSTSLAKTMKTGIPYELELETVKKDGSNGWMWVRSEPARDLSGNITGLWGAAQDITERKQVEQALRENQERYQVLFEMESDALAMIEVSTGNILEMNQAFIDLYGYTRDECLQMKNTDFSHEPDKTQKATIERSNIIPVRWHKKKDGTVFPVEIVANTFAFQGRDVHIAAIRDITERKQLESRLQQTQKMEAISTLAGGIAHDFNNLLSVITGNVSYSLSQLNRDEELFDVLSDVQKGAKQAQNLTHQLLTFSKGGEPVKKVADLNQLIKESAQFVMRGARSRCEFELSDNLFIVEVDTGQINQVISNLVINANQAMPNGGIIYLRTDNVKIEAENHLALSAGRYVKITVEDQGTGISEKHLSNIFDPFYTTKQQGNGLGLSTVYSIVQKHNGNISVYSELEKGTVFNVYIPASEKVSEKIDNIVDTTHQGQGRVLIMDDQEAILKMAERMLNRMGYTTATATDGHQAVEMYKEAQFHNNPFDLVILDLTVPGGMGGLNTIVELLKIDPNVKAIVSSGYSNDPIMANYEEYGFCAVVPKPYTKSLLADVLNKIF